MPIPITTQYDNIDYVLNLARVIINDSAMSLAGNLLANTQPYTMTYMNQGWRKLQRQLRNNGFPTLTKDIQILGVPVVATVDPGIQVALGFNGFFDGNVYSATPYLPPDLMTPLRLWERPINTLMDFKPMGPVNDGLPSRPQGIYLQQWDWIGDQIWMCGCTQIMDLRLRYEAFMADLALDGNSQGVDLVPIIDIAEPLAAYTAAAFAFARGSTLADEFTARGDVAVKERCQEINRKKQRGDHRRMNYPGRAHGGWGFC